MRASQYICIFGQFSEFRIQNKHSTFICVFSVDFQKHASEYEVAYEVRPQSSRLQDRHTLPDDALGVLCYLHLLLLQATALTKAAAVELEACVRGGISLRLRSNQSSCTVSCFTTSILIVLQAAKQGGGWCTRFTSRRRVLRYPCVYGPFTYNRW